MSREKITSIIAFLIIFVFTIVIYYLTYEGRPTPYNNFVRLADAFLQGRLHFLEDYKWLELAVYKGKYYVLPPPMPAIIILPIVAIFGESTNQTLISIFFGSLNIPLAFLIVRKLTNSKGVQIWTTLMFGFGTIHWWVATAGGVWTFSQVISVTFLFLAIFYTLEVKNPFIPGFLLGASYWTRLLTILSFPFFLIMYSDRWFKKLNGTSPIHRIYFKPLIFFCSGVGIFVALNWTYNYVRFDTILDVSYYLKPGIFEEPWYREGIFDISYIPRHLRVIFLSLPMFKTEMPFFYPSLNGLAIWITTPAFIYAFLAGIRNRVSVGCWLSIILIAFVEFTHGTWGFSQFGYRFAVDFYPFLFLLTVKGMGEKIRWHHKILIITGIIVNLWGVLCINVYRI